MLLEDLGRCVRCSDIESTRPERAMAAAVRLRVADLRSCIPSTSTGNATFIPLVHRSTLSSTCFQWSCTHNPCSAGRRRFGRSGSGPDCLPAKSTSKELILCTLSYRIGLRHLRRFEVACPTQRPPMHSLSTSSGSHRGWRPDVPAIVALLVGAERDIL